MRRGVARLISWNAAEAELKMHQRKPLDMEEEKTVPVDNMKRIRDKYATQGYAPYQWVVNKEAPPWHPLQKSLKECRLGLIASGGIYGVGQVAFTYRDDTTFRSIPRDVKTGDLRVTHFAYDLRDARSDPNIVFPIDALRSLVQEGLIGDLTSRFITFMGGIYSARRVLQELAPRLITALLPEQIDVLLLVPVTPVCHQSVGLIARSAEAQGISTLCMSSALDITRAVNPPRAAFLDFPLGHPNGRAHDPELQRAILGEALEAFVSLTKPGSVKVLSFQWPEGESWKKTAMISKHDERLPRYDTPQYQFEEDRIRAMENPSSDGAIYASPKRKNRDLKSIFEAEPNPF